MCGPFGDQREMFNRDRLVAGGGPKDNLADMRKVCKYPKQLLLYSACAESREKNEFPLTHANVRLSEFR
jgi:hypothetical protein